MKQCPFCTGALPDEAVKCIYCAKLLQDKPTLKWYFKTSPMVAAFLCAGPLALPLVWFHPRLSKATKIILTIIIVILSYFLVRLFMNSLKSATQYYRTISGQNFPGF